jgi:hypothetical protein
MAPDESYSMLLLAFLLVVVTQKQFSHSVMELLLRLSRPGATVLLLGILVLAYTQHLHYTFLVLGLIVVFLLKDIWTFWPKSDRRRLELEIGRDQDRFDHSTSIDLQMADKTVTHGPPSMYSPGWSPKLLVFPPSAETQYDMNG